MPTMNTKRTKEEKRVNMKRKVLNVTYRKDSNKFADWMKYEIEIMNEDGSTEMIPAYGKDLQDALRRVVHDEKVEKIEKRAKRVPDLVWIILWFGYILGWTLLTYEVSPYHNLNGLFLIGGMALITSIVLSVKTWFRQRNKDK